ncbi:MAG: hypothetical protein H7A45_13485 [Verrucomicrobiales bacterium]|nr:hypothetical protein [Verrucomicrobiales bacterium]MCP5526763.1 hypothetical protein [Verrucomicrobiales bacterium]
MNSKQLTSGILRLLGGLALIVYSLVTYRRVGSHAAAGEPIQMFGTTVDASSGTVGLMLGAAGLVGLLLVILAAVTLKRRHS